MVDYYGITWVMREEWLNRCCEYFCMGWVKGGHGNDKHQYHINTANRGHNQVTNSPQNKHTRYETL